MDKNGSAPINTHEEIEKEKAALLLEIQQHKQKAALFREQIKMFLRQGLEELPDKQQQQLEDIEAKEQELQERLAALQKIKASH